MENSEPQLLYKGSSRNVYRIKPGTLEFRFKDTFSVFDVGEHHQTIPGKAGCLCETAAASFNVALASGVQTHFIRQTGSTSILVSEMETGAWKAENPIARLLDLEFITRFAWAGSLLAAVIKGTKNPTEYGLASGEVPKEGAWLRWPIEQITTKREAIDRPLTDEEADEIGEIIPSQRRRIFQIIERLDGALGLAAAEAGYRRFDGKKEVGITSTNRIIIGDTFGTLDEDRYAPEKLLRQGIVEDFSKEFIRKIFKKKSYHKQLEEARARHEEDPPYPDLTPREIDEIKDRYHRFADDYTAIRIANFA